MADSITRNISFQAIATLNSVSHLFVGEYALSSSEHSRSYYQTASYQATTSLYLFGDIFYILQTFSKVFGFAAGISGVSSPNSKTETGYWGTQGSSQRGTLTLRELGELQEAGHEKGVRVCQYETGNIGIFIH